jgi:hypothetical protein
MFDNITVCSEGRITNGTHMKIVHSHYAMSFYLVALNKYLNIYLRQPFIEILYNEIN